MKQYQELLKEILEFGEKTDDRTGTGTISRFAPTPMRFDLREGFPLVTTKKVFTRGIIHELLWFIKGDTNTKYLQENGVKIWDEWADKNGDLKKIYGWQWRKCETISDTIVKIKSNIEPLILSSFPYFEKLEVKYSDDLTGERYYSEKSHNYFTVIENIGTKNGNSQYIIQFDRTNYSHQVSRPNLKKGNAFDIYSPNTAGVGYVGEIRNSKNKPFYYDKAYILWRNMIMRCNDKSNPQYKLYGGRGIFVQGRWYNFTNFLEDITKLPNFYNWLENSNAYQLDKDYKNSNCYSKDGCIFLDKKENKALSKYNGIFEGFNETLGISEKFISKNQFAMKYNLNSDLILNTLQGNQKKHKGWIFKEISNVAGYVYRHQRYIDQLAEVIEEIKVNPTSRRLIVSSWNVGELSQMNLMPCHALFQFKVYGEHIDLQLYQRSADTFLGVPFNIASYALLLEMVAQVTELKARFFIHTFGDAHIYNNHKDQVNLQLTREPKILPTLKLNPKIKNIDDFKYEDITIENYEYHPPIKGEVSV